MVGKVAMGQVAVVSNSDLTPVAGLKEAKPGTRVPRRAELARVAGGH